jgi:hypothetical protein
VVDLLKVPLPTTNAGKRAWVFLSLLPEPFLFAISTPGRFRVILAFLIHYTGTANVEGGRWVHGV